MKSGSLWGYRLVLAVACLYFGTSQRHLQGSTRAVTVGGDSEGTPTQTEATATYTTTISPTDSASVSVTDPNPYQGIDPMKCQRGMMIDAGSGGSRLHVYKWAPRVFAEVPPPLSFPTSDEKWTGMMYPGVATYVTNLEGVADHIQPLIDFAKATLAGAEEDFANYPIYFKATGGMRELTSTDREKILWEVKKVLSNKALNPFYFRDEFARVISGEEEAIYSWCSTNFLMGSLLEMSTGSGAVSEPTNSTFGTIDLGGSSTQIAFFQPQEDILEGLFKLQLGTQRHWNVYAKSFLKFGINSARLRFFTAIADDFVSSHPHLPEAVVPSQMTYCLPAGHTERFQTSDQGFHIDLFGPALPASDQLARCQQALQPLLFKSSKSNSYCQQVYHGDCSISGAYQPPIPKGKHGHFIGTSSYVMVWRMLLLPDTTTIADFKNKASIVCAMSFKELLEYYENSNMNMVDSKIGDNIPYFCFLATYVLVMLVDGYGFELTQVLTVVDEVRGNKVGWALGAILYEINSLPWVRVDINHNSPWGSIVVAALIGLILGTIGCYYVLKELQPEHQQVQVSSKAVRLSTNAGGSAAESSWRTQITQYAPFQRHSNAAPSVGSSASIKSQQEAVSGLVQQFAPFKGPNKGKEGSYGSIEEFKYNSVSQSDGEI